jgi:hypothetical protein
LTAFVFSIVVLLPTDVMAAEPSHKDSEVKHANIMTDNTEYGIQPHTDGYYYWAVESKTNQGTVYGSWRLGPQGAGPGNVTVNKTDTVTNTISGSYTSVGDISASLGVSIGKSQSYSVSYSLQVPTGKTYQIKYRPLYTKYKVVQRQYYKIDGYSSPTSNTKTCYVQAFYDWGFDYNVVK